MPDGLTHTKATLAVSGVVLTGLVVANAPLPAVFAGAAGALSGVLLSPDLDVDDGYYGLHVLRRTLGPFSSWLWRTIWSPYAKVMSHRSYLSHFPVLSTILRVVYLYFWYQAIVLTLNVGLFLASSPWHLSLYSAPWQQMVLAGEGRIAWTPETIAPLFYVLGLSASDALHGTLDVLSTSLKHTRRMLHARLQFPVPEMRRSR